MRDSRHERCFVSGAEESASLSTTAGVSHVHMMSDPVRGQLATKFLDTISMTSAWWEKEGEEERKGEIRSVLSIYLSPCLLQCSRSCGTGTRERRVVCMDLDRNQYPDKRCSAFSRPHAAENCNTQPCPGAQSEFLHGHWLYLYTRFWKKNWCFVICSPRLSLSGQKYSENCCVV